ncbi:MAG: acetylesterase [Mogibacterium sp.]|nr:acetylesterase [Mogibacterium sp.]
MASGRMEFHADSIMQHANFSFVIPNDVEMAEVRNKKHYDRERKNLILLHGLTGTDTDWLYGGNAQLMAIQYNLNIFMPTAGNAFYLDRGYKGGNYEQFIAEELPEYIQKTFRVDFDRENTMIGGLSMGGYGAIHTALDYPEKFSACIALSSALIIKGLGSGRRDEVNSVTPEEMQKDVFGDPDKIIGSGIDPEAQYRKLKEAGADIPLIYMAIGTEDYLLGDNRVFRDFLKKEGARLIYEEGPGIHDWFFWNEYLNRGLDRVLAQI